MTQAGPAARFWLATEGVEMAMDSPVRSLTETCCATGGLPLPILRLRRRPLIQLADLCDEGQRNTNAGRGGASQR